MRTARALDFAAIVLVVGTAFAYSADARQRIALKVTLADGTQVRVTEVEGRTAEVKQAGSNGFHLGLIPTYSKQRVTIQIVELADGRRTPVASFTVGVGEPMEFRRARKVTDPPTLRMIAERVY